MAKTIVTDHPAYQRSRRHINLQLAARRATLDSPTRPLTTRPLRRSALGRHAAGVVAGLVSGAAFGLYFIGLNRAGSGADLWPLVAAELGAVVTVVCIAAVTGQLGLPSAGTRWFAVLSGITAAAGTLTYFLATHRGLLAVTAVIASLYPAGTIVLARVLLGEQVTAVRMAGLCLAAASVALIAVAGTG